MAKKDCSNCPWRHPDTCRMCRQEDLIESLAESYWKSEFNRRVSGSISKDDK